MGTYKSSPLSMMTLQNCSTTRHGKIISWEIVQVPLSKKYINAVCVFVMGQVGRL